MLILNKFKINDIISFDLHVDSVLPQDYEHVKVKGVITAQIATLLGADVYATHAQIYRLLPAGVAPDNPEEYLYLQIETSDGQTRILGLPWINADTIKVYNTSTAIFTVTDIAQEDINNIRDVIARYGYHCTVKIE